MPAAVKIFADALTGGDMKELFSQMEDGKLRTEALIKVIDHMATLSDKDLLAKMMNTPAKKFERMRTQWILFLEETNEAGVLDVMIKVFEEATDLMRTASQWLKANQREFDKFAESVKYYYQMFKTILGVLIDHWQTVAAIFVSNKIALGLYGIATAANITSGAFLLAARAVGAFLMRLLFIPTLVAALVLSIEDLNVALKGGKSLFMEWATSDEWYSPLAKAVLLMAEYYRLILALQRLGSAKVLRLFGIDSDIMGSTVDVETEWQAEKENAKRLRDFLSGKAEEFKSTGVASQFVGEKVASVMAQDMIPFSNNMRVPSAQNGWGAGNQTNYVEVVVNNPTSNVDVISAISSAMSDMVTKDMTNYGALQ